MYRRPRRAAMCRVAVGFDGWVGKVVGLSAHERWRWVRTWRNRDLRDAARAALQLTALCPCSKNKYSVAHA